MDKSKEIRKYISLVESINDTIKTSKNDLDEANYLSINAREGKIIAKEIEPVYNALKSDAKISGLLSKVDVKNLDEMLKLIKNDFKSIDNLSTVVPKLLPKEARQLRGAFELGILKSSSTNKNLIDIAAENLVKNQKFIENYKAYGNEVDLVTVLKKNGYSDQAAKNIAKKRFSGKYVVGKQPLKPVINTADSTLSRIKKYTTDQYDKLKKFLLGGKRSWKDILKWGTGLGISGLALWYMLKDNGEKTPVDFPPKPPVVGGEDDTTETPKQTTYHDCYDKDVNNEDIEFGCRSNQVKEIQICLGFEKRYQTGNFGPITMKAIGGNVITKEVYDKIMSKCKGSETVSGSTSGDTTTTTGTTTGDTITTTGTTGNTTNQTVNELDIQDNETGEEYYKRLFDGEYFRSDRENVGRIKLPEDTTVDPDTGEKRNIKFNDKSIKALDVVFDKLKTRRAPYGYYRAKQNVQNDEGDRKFVWFAKKTPDQKTQLSEEKIKNIVIKNLHSLL
jgi:hypothetical protein